MSNNSSLLIRTLKEDFTSFQLCKTVFLPYPPLLFIEVQALSVCVSWRSLRRKSLCRWSWGKKRRGQGTWAFWIEVQLQPPWGKGAGIFISPYHLVFVCRLPGWGWDWNPAGPSAESSSPERGEEGAYCSSVTLAGGWVYRNLCWGITCKFGWKDFYIWTHPQDHHCHQAAFPACCRLPPAPFVLNSSSPKIITVPAFVAIG